MIHSLHAANSLHLLLIVFLLATTLLTSAKDLAVPRGHGMVVTSTATLAVPSRDFGLTCDSTTRPPKLLFRDGITQITDSINIVSTEVLGPDDGVSIRFSDTISMRNASVVSWSLPPKLFEDTLDASYLSLAGLRFSGCDFDVYWLNPPSNNKATPNCTATCPKGESTGMVSPTQDCNGTGCCTIDFGAEIIVYSSSTIEFKFVRRAETNLHHNRSLSWGTIYITADTYISHTTSWSIVDQPDCVSARQNKTSYACVSNKSICRNASVFEQHGYNCMCRNGYIGNPYILDGCSLDSGYNPLQRKMNCIRQCGNISVPFPFGLEEGCFARKGFDLNCTNSTSSTLLLQGQYHIGTPIVSVQWVAAHLTCQDAKRNSSGYACISTNSECITSKPTHTFVGYRCKCAHGYQGNPYITNGCVDINECLQQNICPEMCNNTVGKYTCVSCPRKTEYDPVGRRCLPVEIMDTPYLHGDDIWTGYRILNIDRISCLYLGSVS
uniref:EGF-like domain-containing protein n=1 Tax=Oryza nivara TaxID=4536 RepID=A0A0E0GZL8_ORYNI